MAIPVIIDCDPGTDDAIALLLALASPELDVRAITAVAGNVGLDRTLPNACAIVRLAGASVPVFAGADRPLHGRFPDAAQDRGEDALRGVLRPAGELPANGIAADAIRHLLRESARPMTLIGIGPATNLALALLTEPALVAKVERVVLMSGAWGEGNVTPAAEFNAFCDPEALAAVLAAGPPVVLATLDLTAQALASPERIAALRAAGPGRAIQASAQILAGRTAPTPFPGAPLHDPCAVAWLIRPDLFTTRAAIVEVDCGEGLGRGRTNIDRRPGESPANAVVLETVEAAGLFDLLQERIVRLESYATAP